MHEEIIPGFNLYPVNPPLTIGKMSYHFSIWYWSTSLIL